MALFFVVAIALVPAVLLVPLLILTRWLRRLAAAPRFAARITG